MEKFDRVICKKLTEEIEAAVQEVAARHGIKIVAGNGRFSDSKYTLNIECHAIGENGEDKAQAKKTEEAAELFRAYAPMCGLEAGDLHKEFICKNDAYRIEGWNPGAPKFAVLCKNLANGKTYRFPPGSIKILLKKAA